MITVDPNEKLIEELIKEAEDAPEPGTLSMREVLHRGDSSLPAPVVTAALQSAGYAFIYDTITREQSVTNRDMLPGALKKTRDDGSAVFTTRKPDRPPDRGELTCMLHADAPDRDRYDTLGFPSCPKSNLHTQYDVTVHMQRRHRREWASLEQQRVERERNEDRELQHATLAALSGGMGTATTTAESTTTAEGTEIDTLTCDTCGSSFTTNGPHHLQQADSKLNRHVIAAHGVVGQAE
jgi:hypothetical protein